MLEKSEWYWLEENLNEVEQRIEAACKRAGRKREDVTLIAVSKTKPMEMIDAVAACGITEFGENWVQELKDKTESNRTSIHWHMIGHLQRNKVKYIIDRVSMIHSVDSYRLAQQISSEAKKKGVTVDILIEVNVALEESKFGVTPNEVEALVREIATLDNIRIRGLMTIAPFVENSEENRSIFRKLSELSVDIKSKNIDNVCIDELSMGMTNDFEVAIEEGATLIRVGTAIFGQRDYSKKKSEE